MTIARQLISHHLLLCATPTKAFCCPDPKFGEECWASLKRLIRELGLEDPTREEGIVLRSKVDCLRVCANGPNLLIWPDGIIYESVTPEKIEKILNQHITGGKPIENWIHNCYRLKTHKYLGQK